MEYKYHYIYFKVNSSAPLSNNIADDDSGAIYSQNAYIHFEEKSSTVFKNNSADDNGGSIYSKYGHMYFEGYSFTEFSNNTADDGRGIYSNDGHVTFADKSSTLFKNNNADDDSGAICSYFSHIGFEENSLQLGMSLFCFFSHLFFFPAILLFSTYFSQYFA